MSQGHSPQTKEKILKKVLKEIFKIKGYQIDVSRPNRWQNAGLIMADDRAIRYGNQNTESVYDSRGILFM